MPSLTQMKAMVVWTVSNVLPRFQRHPRYPKLQPVAAPHVCTPAARV